MWSVWSLRLCTKHWTSSESMIIFWTSCISSCSSPSSSVWLTMASWRVRSISSLGSSRSSLLWESLYLGCCCCYGYCCHRWIEGFIHQRQEFLFSLREINSWPHPPSKPPAVRSTMTCSGFWCTWWRMSRCENILFNNGGSGIRWAGCRDVLWRLSELFF